LPSEVQFGAGVADGELVLCNHALGDSGSGEFQIEVVERVRGEIQSRRGVGHLDDPCYGARIQTLDFRA
jgi:hypothetical protein